MGHHVTREPFGIGYVEQAAFKDTYGGVEGFVFLEAHRLIPDGVPSDTVLLFMHPIGGGAYLPMVTQLARAGNHVIYANSRYRGNDSALIMEKVVLDLAAAVKHAKETFGYQKVVLAGWSGGGSLSLYYQQQAVKPTVTATPAGELPDLTAAELIPADGMLLLAAHPSRHQVLVDCTDPSVLDELDPSKRDPELNLYDPQNPNRPPYTAEFLARFSEAQLARNRRITATVKERLASYKDAGRSADEFAFVVHGTMADPRALDPAVDPNDREPGTSFLGDPRVVNDGPIGLARFSTLRSWLSQWSYDDANGDGVRAAADVTVPALVIANSADNICTPRYANAMYDALASDDKQLVTIEGANHYYIGPDQRDQLKTSVATCTEWLAARGLSSAQPVA
ncbi:MAG: alpha/beta fold hydrolase [Solirubrobacteraceae bacterium]|nr:alpha/beta fold hydrolase [Solirubrobacteraceae bacterium]